MGATPAPNEITRGFSFKIQQAPILCTAEILMVAIVNSITYMRYNSINCTIGNSKFVFVSSLHTWYTIL